VREEVSLPGPASGAAAAPLSASVSSSPAPAADLAPPSRAAVDASRTAAASSNAPVVSPCVAPILIGPADVPPPAAASPSQCCPESSDPSFPALNKGHPGASTQHCARRCSTDGDADGCAGDLLLLFCFCFVFIFCFPVCAASARCFCWRSSVSVLPSGTAPCRVRIVAAVPPQFARCLQDLRSGSRRTCSCSNFPADISAGCGYRCLLSLFPLSPSPMLRLQLRRLLLLLPLCLSHSYVSLMCIALLP